MIGIFYAPTIRGYIDPTMRGWVASITPIVRGCVTPMNARTCYIPTCNNLVEYIGFEMKML
jgi:hypothetical protein